MIREGRLHGGLAYLAIGDGPPLVALPGLKGEHANSTGLARLVELRRLEPLARRFTVFLVNRRPRLEAGTTIAGLAEDYAEAIEHAFRDPVPVIGTSTGGSIAQQLAIDHPGLVTRLVLVASACRLSRFGREAQRRMARYAEEGKPRRSSAAVGPALAATDLGGWVMSALLWTMGRRASPTDPSDLVATIEAEDAFDACDSLRRIAAPTLLVAGERDRFYSPALFRQTAARIPRARLLLLHGKGHVASGSHRPAIEEIVRFLTVDDPFGATHPRRGSA